MAQKPKILVFDVETAPMLAYVWGLWDQNIGLNMIKSDWHLLAWAAKWLGDPPSRIMYMDQRHAKDIHDDKKILKGIWDLLDEADIVLTQNGKKFDVKKLNARFLMSGLQPPTPYKHVDTKQIASQKFALTSNKLEYMTDKLCTKYKKLKHHKFQGFELWSECLKGNREAWKEMEKYNKYDVLSLEELYTKLQPWDNSINYNLFTDDETLICSCGGQKWESKGYTYTAIGKYRRLRCMECGATVRDRKSQFTKEKNASLKVKT